ncbi:MAG: 4-oxalocrotonate tautomerase family protein [Elusimicrobiota bacterium]|nr:4-oxalocrotonate tautomerase family protein [Elusimicrobiota bacterium]
MPFINLKMTPGPTAEQKARFIELVTKLAAEVLGKNPATTHVVIEEVPVDSWGIAGETVAARKKRGA